MPFKWTEDQVGSEYKFHSEFSDSVEHCRDCCVGGPSFSSNYVYKQSTQLTCKQGIKVLFCQDSAGTIDLLTFPCSETQFLQNILIEISAPDNGTSPQSAVFNYPTTVSTVAQATISTAPSSTAPSSSASPSVPSSASQLNASLLFPMFMILFYLYIFNRVK